MGALSGIGRGLAAAGSRFAEGFSMPYRQAQADLRAKEILNDVNLIMRAGGRESEVGRQRLAQTMKKYTGQDYDPNDFRVELDPNQRAQAQRWKREMRMRELELDAAQRRAIVPRIFEPEDFPEWLQYMSPAPTGTPGTQSRQRPGRALEGLSPTGRPSASLPAPADTAARTQGIKGQGQPQVPQVPQVAPNPAQQILMTDPNGVPYWVDRKEGDEAVRNGWRQR